MRPRPPTAWPNLRTAARGFTFAEALVGLAVCGLVLAAMSALLTGSAASANRTGATADATMALAIGLETIRNDVGRMVLLNATEDLSISRGGRTLSVRAPAEASPEFWASRQEVVTFALSDSGKDAWPLIRTDDHGPHAVGGCTLGGVMFQIVPAGRLSPRQAYLQVTLQSPTSPRDRTRTCVSALLPIGRTRLPEPVGAIGGGH